MSDYLTNLLVRTQHPERTLQPRVLSIFDPVSPASMGEEVSGWDSREEPYRPAQVNQPISTRDLSARQSSEVKEQDQEDGRLPHEFDTRPRERAYSSILDSVRLTSSSEAASAATPSVLSSGDSDQRGATPKHPSEADAIHLSPIDPTVVSDSPSRVRVRPAQENPASYSGSAAQSASSRLGIPSEQTKSVGQGGSSLVMGESSSESQDNPLVVPTTQAHDQKLSNLINTRGVRVSASSSQQLLVSAATARRDGDQHHRLPTIASESEGALPEAGKQAVGYNVSDFSLDPSLVASVRTTKGAAPSQLLMSRQPGDASGRVSSTGDQQESVDASRTLPKTSNSFLARRRSVAPMTAASVSQVSATDREKPVESIVHVTIGRVEVRAVAPPVRQEKGRKAQSAMSLDDYLKGRGGRSAG